MAPEFYWVASPFNKHIAATEQTEQSARMIRRHALAALLVALVVAGCGREQQQEPTPAATSAQKPDRLTRTTTRAMCGTPEDRAVAISQVAEDPELNAYPDDVYEVADKLAKQGCPKPRS